MQRYLRKESVKESGYIRHLFDRGDQPRLGNWLENLTWARAEAIWDAPLKVLSRASPTRTYCSVRTWRACSRACRRN